jgi:hypothetical protein
LIETSNGMSGDSLALSTVRARSSTTIVSGPSRSSIAA